MRIEFFGKIYYINDYNGTKQFLKDNNISIKQINKNNWKKELPNILKTEVDKKVRYLKRNILLKKFVYITEIGETVSAILNGITVNFEVNYKTNDYSLYGIADIGICKIGIDILYAKCKDEKLIITSILTTYI